MPVGGQSAAMNTMAKRWEDPVAAMRQERRIVTALFADICGSTSITERLDPEDARDVLGGAVTRVIEQVDALGGTVKDLAGDGVLALFGAPTAHEDDAERAVLCGLRVVAAIADYAADVADRWAIPGFSVRVGIETGPVVLGPVGGGSRVEYGAVGDALNTAARLEAQAEPGTVLVGLATRSMVPERFRWGPTHSFELKGKEHSVEGATTLSHVLHRAATAGPLEVPLVGRRDDLARLEETFAHLRRGRGCVVLLEGEAGVGKSRLLAEYRERFDAAFGGGWLEGAAVSYGAAVPYLPYRNLLLAWLQLPLDASPAVVRTAIEARSPSLPPAVRAALDTLDPVIAGWSELIPDDPQAAQAAMFRAVATLVAGLAAACPLAVTLEDLHWSDATSLALTEALAPISTDSPLLLVLTLRPEPAVLAAVNRIAEASKSLTRLRVAPLSRECDRELLRALLGSAVLPRALEERMLDTTDGNPFFMEEQVRALIDKGMLVRTDGAWHYVGAATVQLAPTVERALMARIDRLADQQRATLLAASVLGPRFDAAVLAEVVGADPWQPLADLVREHFLLTAGKPGDGGAYRFRHALVQEAAYQSLLRRQRRELHARAAVAIEAQYVGRTDEAAVTLGRHLAEAGEADRAVGYLLVGARRAAAAFANEEAAALSEQALALLMPLVESAAEPDRRVTLELLEIRVTALRFLARYDEAVDALRTAIALTPAEEPLARARLHVTAGNVLVDAHDYAGALAELEAAHGCIGDRLPDDEGFALWLDVQLGRGNVFYWQGDVRSYTEMLEEVEPHVRSRATVAQRINFYNAVRSQLWRRDRYVISDELLRLDRSLYEAQRESEDPEDRAWAPFLHGFTLLWHRDLDQAEPLLRQALAHAEELEDALLRSRSLTYLMVAARLHGDVEEAEALIEPVRQAAREAGLPEYEATASATAAWTAWRRGRLEEAQAAGRDAMETWERLPTRYFIDWMACLPLLAASLAAGDVAEAVRWAAPVLAETQQPLPGAVAAQVRAALDAAGEGNDAQTAERLAAAVKAAREDGCL
jgi:class 3 adenylate cyclase/tetratricopeptide (TPR) repeat protein